MNYPKKLYNYIEKNKDLKNKIKEYQVILIQRRYQKKKNKKKNYKIIQKIKKI